MLEFTWVPSYNAQLEEAPNLLTAKFNDGYEQSVPNGLNFKPKKWNLTFDVVTIAEANEIISFFRSQCTLIGFEPFLWTDLDGDSLKYTCKSWSRIWSAAGYHQVSAPFTQWFG